MHQTRIYQQLSGRLGNQLFQWAYSHQLNLIYGERIVLFHDSSHSVSGYLGNIDSLIQPCTHVNTPAKMNSLGILLKGFDKLHLYFPELTRKMELKFSFHRAKNHFEISLPEHGKPKLVTGFFVNWQTLKGIEEVLFRELAEGFKRIQNPANMPPKYQVMHVRRGDFVGLKDSYGILHPKYYLENADRRLITFICTDDEGLAEDIRSKMDVERIFGPNDLSPFEAMKLMANASSLIMSNSTLSWWAGFYCAKNGGTVVMPKPFYKIETNGSLYHPDFVVVPSVFY